MRDILVLGATGSIGSQTLDLLKYSNEYRLIGVSLRSHTEKLEPYLFYFPWLKIVAIEDEESAKAFAQRHPSLQVIWGADVSLKLLRLRPEADVVNALMGVAGLRPTLLALRQGQDLMLSNKESLVLGSSLVRKELSTSKSHLYPIDSEHVGLAKLLKEARRRGVPKSRIRKLIVTASGGSLRDLPKEEALKASPEQVLRHPTWSMGKKITVDSATLVNKGYEVIEASTLFSFPLSKIGARICRESLVHAELVYAGEDGKDVRLVEYSPADMKVAIAYALSRGTLSMHPVSAEDEEQLRKLHFGPVDEDFYPLFRNTIQMYELFGNLGIIYYDALDAEAVSQFLSGRIPFAQLIEALRYLRESFSPSSLPALTEENLPALTEQARKQAKQTLLKVRLFSR